MLKAMSKFQGVLKMFMLGVLKTMLKYKKKHFMACVEIERQISFFSFNFAHITEVRHMQSLKNWFSLILRKNYVQLMEK